MLLSPGSLLKYLREQVLSSLRRGDSDFEARRTRPIMACPVPAMPCRRRVRDPWIARRVRSVSIH